MTRSLNRGDTVAGGDRRGAAGVVDEDIDAAEPLDAAGDHGVDLLGVAHVARHEDAPAGRRLSGISTGGFRAQMTTFGAVPPGTWSQ